MRAGLAREVIKVDMTNTGMMGYGQPHNTVHSQLTPLYARALYIEGANQQKFVWVNMEMCFITIALHQKVINHFNEKKEFGLNSQNIILTAQHTHSAPGGYSHFPLYNFSIPGFVPSVFDNYFNAIIQVIECAIKNATDAKISFGEVAIPDSVDVAFNRSMRAYNANPDVIKLSESDHHKAVDRVMSGLKIEDANGKLLGMLNLFGVHATSVSSFNHAVHHDNKGVAAEILEKQFESSVFIFAQKAAGDVSPNFIYDPKLGRSRGASLDQYENAKTNGALQAQWAKRLLEKTQLSLQDTFQTGFTFIDMPKLYKATYKATDT